MTCQQVLKLLWAVQREGESEKYRYSRDYQLYFTSL